MGHLVVPKLTGKQIGRVITTLTIVNLVDQILATRGFMPDEQVRSVTIDDVIVDTGATMLCLPEEVISQVGLTLLGEIDTKTATGVSPQADDMKGKARIFRAVSLTVEGREGIFDCLELPTGQDALLGVIPLEQLGLEPDLKNQQLKVLPMNQNETYLSI